MAKEQGDRRDFFISYARPDAPWARWVADQLEAAGLRVEIDEWDWRPGSDAVQQMNAALLRADRVLALWSTRYFDPASWAGKELSAGLFQAHRAQAERLVPVIIDEVVPPPLFQPLVAISLTGLSEREAAQSLLDRLLGRTGRGRPHPFPGKPDRTHATGADDPSYVAPFPGAAATAGRPGRAHPADLAVLPASNLARLTDRFIGRTAEVAHCRKLILDEGCRLLTVVGSAGSGKTRFSQELARTLIEAFDDHVYFVDLTAVTDPSLVVTSITRALRIEAGDPVFEALKELFREKRALLLLDNFEHVIGAALTVRELLEAAPQLCVVVTSRETLQVPGELTFDLQPLAREEAIGLFVTRAPGTSTTDADVAELCKRLDDLPLAIELVAARARWYAPGTLLTMLGHEVLDLPATMRGGPARHRTLRAAIAWSYELLDAAQQRLFCRLSIFQGGWTLNSAAAVAWPTGKPDLALADAMASLLERRLLREELEPDRRLGMLQTLRQYALKRLEANAEDASSIRRRHADHFLLLAEEAASQLTGRGQSAAFQQLEREQENLAAALAHLVESSDVDGALRLAAALGHYWWSRDYSEGWARLGQVLCLPCPDHLRGVRAQVLKAQGQIAIRLGRLEGAAALFDQMLAVAKACGDIRLEAAASGRVALVLMEHAQFDLARPLLEQALALQRGKDDIAGIADTLDSLGVLATGEGRYDEAERRLRESLSAYREVADEQGEGWVRTDLARLALARGDIDAAAAAAGAAWAIGQQQKDWGLIAWARNYLGLVAARRGDYAQARKHHSESLSLVTLLGDKRPIALAIEGFAALAAQEGEAVRAYTLMGAAAALRAAVGIPRTAAEAAMVDPAIERARTAVPAGERSDAVATGQRLTLEQAVLLARGA